MKRREFLAGSVGTACWLAASRSSEADELTRPDSPLERSGLGLVIYCCRHYREQLLKRRSRRDLFQPQRFLEHCRQLGAGGMQVSLGSMAAADVRRLREQAEQWGLYIEAIIRLPQGQRTLEQFSHEMQVAVDAGAQAVRTTMIPGRRYETFSSLDEFHAAEAAGRAALVRAAPVAEKLKLPLAVENHKDHRNAERVQLFESISSEYVGACLDTGNSVALLEDPLETAQAFAPWTHSVHLKDQAVKPYADGFLLGDIPLGQGFIDLKSIVELIKRKRPQVKFSLELITRDPLKVPVFDERYWRTFPELPASALARMMRAVKAGATDNLQDVSGLTEPERVKLEHTNVRSSLDYARDVLQILPTPSRASS